MNHDSDISTSEPDRIYASPMNPVPPFSFDDQVARVFPDMIRRSVPGYEDIIDMIGLFARRYVQPDSRCYDLGASLGAASLAMRRNISVDGCEIIAVDNSAPMIERCRQHMSWDQSRTPVRCVLSDISRINIQQASMVVLNFTLQFIEPEDRQALIQNIHDGLVPGGILVLSEKLHYPDAPAQEIMTSLHLDFKRMNGYSDLEIAQKRQSLENVLRSNSAEELISMMGQAGFETSFMWFQHLTFSSFFARKAGPPKIQAGGTDR